MALEYQSFFINGSMISLKYAVLSTKQKMETLNFPVSFSAYGFAPSFSLVESSLKLTFGTGILDLNLSCFFF